MNPGHLVLAYGAMTVGYIDDAFESDATWFGMFKKAVSPDGGVLQRRLSEFIDFCVDWNARTKDNPDPPAASEFDRYSDLLTSGLWTTTNADGQVRKLLDAPVFFRGNEVTWISQTNGERYG
jgi:hypothetical protein